MVTGRVPKDLSGLWMRVSTHKYLFIFLHCIYSWLGRQELIFQNNFAILDLSFLRAKTELGTVTCCKEYHQAMRVRWKVFCFSGLDSLYCKPSLTLQICDLPDDGLSHSTSKFPDL